MSKLVWPVMRLACSPCHYPAQTYVQAAARHVEVLRTTTSAHSFSTGVEWLVVYQLRRCNGPGNRAAKRLLRCWAVPVVPHMIHHLPLYACAAGVHLCSCVQHLIALLRSGACVARAWGLGHALCPHLCPHLFALDSREPGSAAALCRPPVGGASYAGRDSAPAGRGAHEPSAPGARARVCSASGSALPRRPGGRADGCTAAVPRMRAARASVR
jgi:hypothetical protein